MMELIKKLGTRLNKNGNKESWGRFKCPICLKESEMRLSDGYKCKSCGCNKNKKHGESKTRLYKIWVSMKHRCYDPKTINFKDYGGKGIIICQEWLDEENGFIKFRDWSLANGYADNLTIDRIENNLGYSPENCQWITQKENSQKRNTTKINLQIADEIRDLYNTGNYIQKELAGRFNVSREHISDIINNKRWE